jgi:hypothetical protein
MLSIVCISLASGTAFEYFISFSKLMKPPILVIATVCCQVLMIFPKLATQILHCNSGIFRLGFKSRVVVLLSLKSLGFKSRVVVLAYLVSFAT